MKMLGPLGTETFNALLRQWRAEGKHICWDDLDRAYRLARGAEEAEETKRKPAGKERGP